MSLIKKTAKLLYELTKEKPLILHIDAIGFFSYGGHIGKSIEEITHNKLDIFAKSLIMAEEMGANVIIPTFSYTITKDEVFDVLNTPSEVGAATETLRKLFPYKRTYDPIFSYLVFSKNELLKKDFKIKNFNTFGKDSLIETVYNMNGYIGSIGDVLWRTTEAHFIEKKLNVSYRQDKVFLGKITDQNGKSENMKSIFYCRNLSIGRQSDFKPIINNMKKNSFVGFHCIDEFCIETVKFHTLLSEMQKQYRNNSLYFTKKEEKQGSP